MTDIGRRVVEFVRNQINESVSLLACRPLTGGACQENYRVDLSIDDAPASFVLRSDSETSLPGSLGRRDEFAVIKAAHEAGVCTPRARWLGFELARNGAWAYALDWLDGETIGARILNLPSVVEHPERLTEQLMKNLSRLHALPLDFDSEDGLKREPFRGEDAVGDALRFARLMLDALPHPRPASEWIIAWLRANQPSASQRRMTHGDYRVGNFMVDPYGNLRGILDWEFAHWGDPYEDLGWFCVRDWRFGRIAHPAGGLVSRLELCRLYERFSGHPIDLARLHFWEVFGNLRWALSADLQGQRYRSGGDFELLGIPRRAIEMEYEALRLIKSGPNGWGVT